MAFFQRRPRLSIVVIVYKMPDQAEKTLYSLSPLYQQGVSERDYEVIVVENHSDRLLGGERATRHAGNVRYFHRQETQRTPVHAINFGAAQARGSHVAIMIDGRRIIHASGRSMSVEIEPLADAVARILPVAGPVTTVRRVEV